MTPGRVTCHPYPEATLLLRISIGPLAADNQVTEPVPFPDDYLPGGDLVIDVAVSSTSFKVGRDLDLVPDPDRYSAEDRFILPGDGSPARTRDGRTELIFVLRAPSQPGPARLRILYYYRGAVVQSQLLTMDIGGLDPWSIGHRLHDRRRAPVSRRHTGTAARGGRAQRRRHRARDLRQDRRRRRRPARDDRR